MIISKDLKTDEIYLQGLKREDGIVSLSIYHNIDEGQFLEAYFSKREFEALVNTLTELKGE